MDAATSDITRDVIPSEPSATGRALLRAGPLLHSGVSVRGFYTVYALGATVPLVAGTMLFGWRALATVASVVASALLAWVAWRNIGSRGRQIVPAQVLWSALLVGLMLPAHLASTRATPLPDGTATPCWPVLMSAGVLIAFLHWLVGGIGTGRFHVALATTLILHALFWQLLTPNLVLSRQHLAGGDLLNSPRSNMPATHSEAWLERRAEDPFHAFQSTPASYWMSLYSRGRLVPESGRMPLHELLRDRMPPLEDLVVGGHPMPIGQGSLIAVVVGGLFLLYRGVIDYRVPLGMMLAMYVTLLVLPTPTLVTNDYSHFRWLMFREPDVRWETAITFVNYQIAAGPAVFTAFFVATSPGLRPLARRARLVFAMMIGVLAAAGQLYVSAAIGPYLAVAVVGLIAPALDRWFHSRTLLLPRSATRAAG